MYKKHLNKKWEVSIIGFKSGKFKVTRQIPDLSVSETKMFENKELAIKQFNEWLR
jgi:hypothetical protein